ncbi:MAG: hypothetical protein HQK94_18390 [Nitrospirae bacterium]|nr:hypothetical protein [Nitrospirota bacterium]
MKDIKLLLMIDGDMLDRIERYRIAKYSSEKKIMSKSEAVRKLVDEALTTDGYPRTVSTT